MSFDGLSSLFSEALPPDVAVGRVVLVPERTEPASLLAPLELLFAENETLAAVEVLGMDNERRLVARTVLLDALGPVLKGIGGLGDSEHLTLQGKDEVPPGELVCPVDRERFTYFFIEPGEKPTCPNHPGTELVFV